MISRNNETANTTVNEAKLRRQNDDDGTRIIFLLFLKLGAMFSTEAGTRLEK